MECKNCDGPIWIETTRSNATGLCKGCLRQLRYLELLEFLARDMDTRGSITLIVRVSKYPSPGHGPNTFQQVALEVSPERFTFKNPPTGFEELSEMFFWNEVTYVGGKTFNPLTVNRQYVIDQKDDAIIGVTPLPEDQKPYEDVYLSDIDMRYVMTLQTKNGLRDFWLTLVLQEQLDEPIRQDGDTTELYGPLYEQELHEIFRPFLEESRRWSLGDFDEEDIPRRDLIRSAFQSRALVLRGMSAKALNWGLGRLPYGDMSLLTTYY